ncbi:MAG: glycosyl hydrolase [Mobilitalea sp.]
MRPTVLKLSLFMTLIIAMLLLDLGTDINTKTAKAAENLAYRKAVTVSSTESSSYPGSNAVDANGNTRWSSAYANNQNFIVDLGANYTVSQVKLAWEAAYASQYQIQTSTNNSTWTTVHSNYNSTGGTQTISFAATTARYVKVYCIQRATAYGFSLWEVEVYGSGSGSSGSVMDYINSISGNKTMIGIHNREPNSDPDVQTERAYSITGQYPALWSGDFLFSSSDVANRWTMIYECKRQWDNGSIVQLMLHVVPPTQSEPGSWDGGVVSKLSDSQWNDLITNGGSLNTAWKKRLDTYATYLQYLEDNGVTVLFRPFHEMNQGIFWWAGRSGSNGTAALYRLTHDYLENTKGLSNLIWVWDMQDLDYNWSGYNPGNDYWDIFALDVYNGDGFTTQKYNTALSVAGNKPIAIGECATLPTASLLASQPRWVFVMSWAEMTFDYNSNAAIQNLYWAQNVIVRNELPDF